MAEVKVKIIKVEKVTKRQSAGTDLMTSSFHLL